MAHNQHKNTKHFDANEIKVIAFDLDGTLIDASNAMLEVDEEVFGEAVENGHAERKPTKEEIYDTFGMIGDEAWAQLSSGLQEDQKDQYRKKRDERLQAKMDQNSYALSGVPQLLQSLSEKGYKLATASNCGDKYLEQVLAQDGLSQWIDYPLCAGNVGASEKSDVLMELLKQSGLDASQALMVGDRKSDIEAAQKAGMPVVGVQSEFAEDGELDEANAVIDDIQDLEKWLSEHTNSSSGSR
ncbi:HAD family hydrolase [Saccharibacillus sp. JS10]|uniref:HAD family hydrolase n=1 Tax=Saccharibacillus sp. JS10 TaxID=2950552 RepID=UPI00210CCCD8|nr:HAD family hydrolase [Saccharibacillus sp. JS10]MCQ4086881.1 HAD family hydrolase [Saccharibacillus sp. JS10]